MCMCAYCGMCLCLRMRISKKKDKKQIKKCEGICTVQLSTWAVAMSRTCRDVVYSYSGIVCYFVLLLLFFLCDDGDHISKWPQSLVFPFWIGRGNFAECCTCKVTTDKTNNNSTNKINNFIYLDFVFSTIGVVVVVVICALSVWIVSMESMLLMLFFFGVCSNILYQNK